MIFEGVLRALSICMVNILTATVITVASATDDHMLLIIYALSALKSFAP